MSDWTEEQLREIEAGAFELVRECLDGTKLVRENPVVLQMAAWLRAERQEVERHKNDVAEFQQIEEALKECRKLAVKIAIQRAEAAEKRVAELEAENASWLRGNESLHLVINNLRVEQAAAHLLAKHRIAELEAENARLRDRYDDTPRLSAVAVESSRLIALVHSRLDAMGVPACEEVVCQCVRKTIPGPGCNCTCDGSGKVKPPCRISARLDWVAERLIIPQRPPLESRPLRPARHPSDVSGNYPEV